MHKIKIPSLYQTLKIEDDKKDHRRGDPRTHEAESVSEVDFEEKNGVETLNNIITAAKNPSIIFKPPFGTSVYDHHSKLGVHAQHLWKCNKITDLTVKFQSNEYPCHKTVLSCYSKYFKELLIDEKGTVSVINLRLPSITTTAFEVLLTYMYTSELNLTCQNIGEVYTAARKLGIDGALILCTKIFTGKYKCDVYSVYVYVTAKKLKLHDCAAKALKMMANRFERIVGTPEFLDLEFSEVLEYLSQDVLATRSEVIVFLAALKWISVKYLEREQYASELIGCVRFQMMTLNEILACFSPPLLPGVLEQKKIRDNLLAATCYVAAATVNEERRFERYSCRKRKYLFKREAIILWDPSIFDPDRHAMYVEEMAATKIQAAFRGYKTRKSIDSDKAAGILKKANNKYLVRSEEFEPPKDDEDETYVGSRKDSGLAQSFMKRIRKSVVSFMGSTENDEKSEEDLSNKLNEEIEDQYEVNEESKNEFSPRRIPALPKSSSIDTLVTHVNNLAENTEIKKYTSDTAVDMSSETFQQPYQRPKNTDTLYRGSSYEEDLIQSSSTTSESEESSDDSEVKNFKGCILVAGGFRSDSKDVASGKTIFIYDTSSDHWERYGKMEKARHHHSLVLLNGDVYFIGGCDLEKFKAGRMVPDKACYKLSLQSKTWSKISKMTHSRMYHGVAEVDGKIYVIGGKDSKDNILRSVEVYYPDRNKWKEIDTPLETPTMGAGVCVHEEKIWVVGGMVQNDGGEIILLSEVKCFDPRRKRWSNLQRLPFPRAFSTIVSFEKEVYVIGGTSQTDEESEEKFTSLSDVLYYDKKKEYWNSTANLPFPKHFVQAVIIGSRLYVLGGLSSYENAAETVVWFEKKTRKWRSCSPLPEPVCGFAAICLPDTSL